MTKEEIIRMAREASVPYDPWPNSEYNKNIERFFQAAYAAGAAAEREACAKVADDWGTPHADRIAAAIRARGNT